MRKIRDVLRLKLEARLSHERCAAALNISKGGLILAAIQFKRQKSSPAHSLASIRELLKKWS